MRQLDSLLSRAMECNKGFASNYLLVKKEEVRFFDLISLLFDSNIGKRKFIDSSEPKEESFVRRFIIFLSVVIQKLLQFLSTPMFIIGTVLEFILNLFYNNGNNVFKLLLNLLTGKLKIPKKTSENYISFAGHLDLRRDLDKNIKRENAKYKAALSMMASKAAYENQAYVKNIVSDYWKMEFLGFYDFWNDYQNKAGTQGFIFRDKTEEDETIIVSFRGTEGFNADDWCTDFDISWYEFEEIGKIHAGFMKALGLQKNTGWPNELDQTKPTNKPFAYYTIRERLRDLLSKNDKAKFIVTGHSLGGALAALFPVILVFHDEMNLLEKLRGVYTFGQPRVGDGVFAEYMANKFEKIGVKYYRFVYCNDLVPRVPFEDSTFMFKHFESCVYFNRDYWGRILEEEPMKNYFSVFGQVWMKINASMELLRSLTLQYTEGEEYKQTGLMTLARFVGLVIPGVAAHSTQEYVNSTRLGTILNGQAM